ncbi:MAG: hypothetical protein Q9160_005805 [Pyrenula sp. 1 TL-2023]
MDYPYPTIAAITGHAFGGGVPLALACDYRVMHASQGWICMPPVDLGLWFPGIGALPAAKLSPGVARRMLLEGERWGGREARREGIVDETGETGEGVQKKAREVAARVAERAKGGVYGVLRGELWRGVGEGLRAVSGVHARRVGSEGSPRAKI